MENKVKEHIDAIIKDTFTVLKDVYDHQKEGCDKQPSNHLSRLIFPKYSKKETRLSEQELRFVFVEQFNQYCASHNLDWYYSVETPTEYKYIFSEEGSKKDPRRDDEKGQSAMVDLSIHDSNLNRLALIEFKALNPDKSCFTKDFVKLREEPEDLAYFIMYVKSHHAGTIKSLKGKIEKKASNTEFVCYDLTTGKPIENEIISFNK